MTGILGASVSESRDRSSHGPFWWERRVKIFFAARSEVMMQSDEMPKLAEGTGSGTSGEGPDCPEQKVGLNRRAFLNRGALVGGASSTRA